MDYKITLEETISISDHIRAETETDAIIYRNEFQKHYGEYLKTSSESELILVYIIFQIYIECFLHQNMRHIVALEFKPPRENINERWLAGERRKIPEKIVVFPSLFNLPGNDVQTLVDEVKTKFSQISYIRNLFAHGHKVAAWSDSEGKSGLSTAKKLLTTAQLRQTLTDANDLGIAWNKLLDVVIKHCKSLQRVDDFKFNKIIF